MRRRRRGPRSRPGWLPQRTGFGNGWEKVGWGERPPLASPSPLWGGIQGGGTATVLIPPRPSEAVARPAASVHPDRHEAQFAGLRCQHQQRVLAALLLQRRDPVEHLLRR